jgi:hypothetical protein
MAAIVNAAVATAELRLTLMLPEAAASELLRDTSPTEASELAILYGQARNRNYWPKEICQAIFLQSGSARFPAFKNMKNETNFGRGWIKTVLNVEMFRILL